jgi:hypothetical protein
MLEQSRRITHRLAPARALKLGINWQRLKAAET